LTSISLLDSGLFLPRDAMRKRNSRPVWPVSVRMSVRHIGVLYCTQKAEDIVKLFS